MRVAHCGPETGSQSPAQEFRACARWPLFQVPNAGSIQITGAGEPIVLLADRGTTGGYPKIATVVSADLPTLGRALPGTEFRFAIVDVENAEEAVASADAELRARAKWILPVREAWSGR